jgi:SanA protein
MKKKIWIRLFLAGFCLASIVIGYANFSVFTTSKNHLYNSLKEVPEKKTGLLLGTSRTLKNGMPNQYFYLRIKACVELFEAGKIKQILISGDNGTKAYNEPLDMKEELMRRGVPENKIFLDYAGFDTYDSVIRANRIFGQDEFVVVSQKFHNQRAVYIGRKNGLSVIGYNARDVKKMSGLKTKIREYFACVKAFLDVTFNVDPYFLREKEPMP